MEHISALKNMGEGKKCLLIGNGLSLRDFDLYKVPGEAVRIGMGITFMACDYIIYYDREPMKHYAAASMNTRTRLIGYKHGKADHTCAACSYYYNHEDMIFGDTGFHVLQFADKIFNFDEIYLIGYDYCTSEKSYHFEEEKSDPDDMKKFLVHSCGKTVKEMPEGWKPVIDKYNDIEWRNKIYNCNKRSALKAFPFKNIY